MDDRPIGILDSGYGGLTIANAINDLLPKEGIVYFGDNAFAPYGKKDPSVIRERVSKTIAFLLTQNTKLIVIACNTATVVGIDYFRDRFPEIPIVGVVPVIKKAAELTKTHKIAVLETSLTAKSPYQSQLIKQFASGCKVIEIACDDLVEQIEAGDLKKAVGLALECLTRIDLSSVDVLALGCTHFVFIKEFLRKDEWEILDSSGAVARQVKKILENNKIFGTKNSLRFFTSGDSKKFVEVGGMLSKIEINQAEKAIF